MLRWPSSLRSRLTLWYTVSLALPLVGFAIASYFAFAATLDRHTDRFIADALTAFSNELEAERRVSLSAVRAMQSTIAEVRFHDLHIVALDRDREVVAAGRDIDPRARDSMVALIRRRAASAPAVTLGTGERAYRVISRPLVLEGESFTLAAAYPLSDVSAMLTRIRRMFLIAIPSLVLCAAAGGYLLARRSLAPVASMAHEAASITATSLDQRLSVGGGEELVGLARVVNGLLDRLEQAFAQQRRFVADASHELRTPTTIVRTEAEVTLSRDHRPEGEYRDSVTVMRDAARRLTRIVDELFLLARADAGHLVARPEAIYLEDVVDQAVRAVQGLAEQHRIRIELGNLVEAPARGDPDLLGRLLLNLLDNAIKYSPEGETVRVEMGRHDGRCEIAVVNPGPGIPPADQDQVFDRFFRVDRSRSRAESGATGGAGLGLAIARRIAEMHAGRLELVESRPGRTEFRLALPLAPPA